MTQARTEVDAAPDGPGVDQPSTSGSSDQPRRWIAWTLVAGLVLVAAGIGVAQLRDVPAKVALTAGDNVVITSASTTIAAHNSPTIAINPTDPNTLVAVDRVDRPRFSAAVHTSRDGGQTWTDSSLVLPEGEDRPFAPDVAYDADGTLFVVFTTLKGKGNSPGAVWLEQSTDDGTTFGPPVKVTGDNAFQSRLAVNPRTGDLHITWVQTTDAVEPIPNGFPPPPNPVVMSTSTDAGASFSEPVQVSSADRSLVGAATPVVGPDDEVYVLYQDFGDDEADFQGTAGPVHDGRFSLVLARSTDSGKTFDSEEVVDDDLVPTERFLVYLPQFPSIAIDPRNGSLYIAWADGRNGDSDVFLRRSADGGRSWSNPSRVNDDKVGSGARQYLPRVSVAPTGRVDVVFLDRRDDDDNDTLTSAYYAASADEGESWTNLPLSDVLFDSKVGPGSELDKADAGTRIGVVSTPTAAYAVWTDTRNGSLDTDKQDIVFAAVTIKPE